MTLYLKYRSKTLDELDLEEVRESLKKTVASGSLPHAFLFSGPKGTGKTSAARILAKIVNCESTTLALRGPRKIEPCNQCSQCTSIAKGENLDVIELDAASHRGIDDIRTLREAVKLAPARANKKVYIIDEAHMLTTEAANALLKTLEEPPPHVMFILATTNPEKLIETIRSRATNIIFRKAKPEEIVRSLGRVVKGEKLKLSNEILELIAKVSDGSFRDATKILEQIIVEKIRLEKDEIEEFLLRTRVFDAEKFLEILANKKVKEALVEIEKSVSQGASPKNMTYSLIERLREGLMAVIGINGGEIKYFTKEGLIKLLKLFSKASEEIPTSLIEQLPLEIAVVEWCESKLKIKNSKLKSEASPSTETRGISLKKSPSAKASSLGSFIPEYGDSGNSETSLKGSEDRKLQPDRAQKVKEDAAVPSVIGEISETAHANGEIEGVWKRVLSQVRPINASTEALLRAAKPINYDGKNLTLGVYYRFHKERLEANPHRDILEEVIETVTGTKVRVWCTLTEPPFRPKDDQPLAVNKVEETITISEIAKSDSGSEAAKEPVLTESDSAAAASDAVLTESEDEDIIRVAKEVFGS